MFLTPCVMVWIALTVLSLPVRSDVKVIQPYKVVSTNGTAQVRCLVQPSYHQTLQYPYPEPEDLSVTLLKGLHGTQKLCSTSILNFKEQRKAGVEEKGEVQCSARAREGALEVTVSGLKATDTDLYRCVIEILYPPPYLRLMGNGTLIHVFGSSDCPVLGAQRQISDEGEDEEGEERMAPVSVPVVVLVILVIFVLILIIYFQAVQCERRRTDVRPVPSVQSVPSMPHKAGAAAFSC